MKIKLITIFIIFMVFINIASAACVRGYKLYWGTETQIYTDSVDVGMSLSTTVTGLTEGTTYYFTAVAYGHSGEKSYYSNEVSGPSDASGEISVAWDASTSSVCSKITGITIGSIIIDELILSAGRGTE